MSRNESRGRAKCSLRRQIITVMFVKMYVVSCSPDTSNLDVAHDAFTSYDNDECGLQLNQDEEGDLANKKGDQDEVASTEEDQKVLAEDTPVQLRLSEAQRVCAAFESSFQRSVEQDGPVLGRRVISCHSGGGLVLINLSTEPASVNLSYSHCNEGGLIFNGELLISTQRDGSFHLRGNLDLSGILIGRCRVEVTHGNALAGTFCGTPASELWLHGWESIER